MNFDVANKIELYSENARSVFRELRLLIYEVAKANDLGQIEETLKWRQPSYLCKYGSTIRIDWSQEFPDQISIFFNCKTNLVETFKEVFKGDLNYKGNRVVIVSLTKPVPPEIEACFLMALNYHRLKTKPLLGA